MLQKSIKSKGLDTLYLDEQREFRLRAQFDTHTGYGVHACNIARSFFSFGYAVKGIPTVAVNGEWKGYQDVREMLVTAPAQIKNELVLGFVHTKAEPDQWLYTMYETTRMPAASFANVCAASAIIVPSTWCQQCFDAQGVNRPIYVVPLGVDTTLFSPAKSYPKLCVFGAAGNVFLSGSERKNIELVFTAFKEAFGNSHDVRLRLKLQDNCPVSCIDDPRVDIIRANVEEADMASWFQSLTAYVSPSRCEAFGQMNLQAMACGVPVICCAFGGVTDYHSAEHGYNIEYKLTSPTNRNYQTGLWAEPDFDSLVEQMLRVYMNRKEAATKGRLAVEIAHHFSWDAANKELETALNTGGFWKIEKNQARLEIVEAAPVEAAPVEAAPVCCIPVITVKYSLSDITGLGQQSTLFVRELVRRKAKFTVIPTSIDESYCKMPPEVSDNVGTSILGNIELTMAAISDLPWFDSQVRNILWTMWESTLLKPEWVTAINSFDSVIVACNWNAIHFKESGVTVPIHIVPLAIDDAFLFSSTVQPATSTFTFLAGGDALHGGERKGIKMVMECFEEAFNAEDVCLSIKLAPGRKIPVSSNKRICFNNAYLSNAEMAKWYASGHVFVSAATAEGWGLMQTQAMACGRPVIGARYAGHAEYLNNSTGYLIDYEVKPATGLYAGLGNWAELNRASLIKQMRLAYSDFVTAKQVCKTQACRNAVREFSTKNFANGLLSIITQLNEKLPVTCSTGCFVPKPTGALDTPKDLCFEPLRKSKNKAWYHAGDLGDVIYGLPAIKEQGGGRLYLGPQAQLTPDLNPRVGITEKSFEFIAPLLRAQPYVTSAEWSSQCPMVAANLNMFRYYWHNLLSEELQKAKGKPPYSLAWMHLAACGIEQWDETRAWLSAKPSEISRGRIIIHRSYRYQNVLFPWKKIMETYGKRIAFVGLPLEHEGWCREFGFVDYFRVKNALEMAEIIAGSDLFIGNQSFPMALAIGLGVNIIQETRVDDIFGADCVFERDNIQYVLNEFVHLEI